MNLILFDPAEIGQPLSRDDRRAAHILNILRRQPGETFDAGIINGPTGKGRVCSITDHQLELTFAWEAAIPMVVPLSVIVGLTRPQTARDILRESTALGVGSLHFVRTEKSEPGYAQSTLWTSGEWRRHVIAGAEQAFDTRIPSVTYGGGLAETLASLPSISTTTRIALDNYEASTLLGAIQVPHETHPVLALGAERGWSEPERQQLREQGFAFAQLGRRVLRTETACIAALTLIRAKLGLM